MSLLEEIRRYRPEGEQEERDREVMLRYIPHNADCLERSNLIAHFTASIWTVNPARTRTLMAYHNIYDSWAWIGGHADGVEDLAAVAMRELREETGVRNARLVSRDILSLEALTVEGHEKKGVYVPSHLHLNVTYLAEADEDETLVVNEAENQAVRWWTFGEALRISKEPWFVRRIYPKLIERCQRPEWAAAR